MNTTTNSGVDDSILGPYDSNFAPIYDGHTEGDRIDINNNNNNDNNGDESSGLGGLGGGEGKQNGEEDGSPNTGGAPQNQHNININVNAPVVYFARDQAQGDTRDHEADPLSKLFSSTLTSILNEINEQNVQESGGTSNSNNLDNESSQSEQVNRNNVDWENNAVIDTTNITASESNNTASESGNDGILNSIMGPANSNFGPIYTGQTDGNRVDINNNNNNDNDNNENGGGSNFNANLNINAPIIYFRGHLNLVDSVQDTRIPEKVYVEGRAIGSGNTTGVPIIGIVAIIISVAAVAVTCAFYCTRASRGGKGKESAAAAKQPESEAKTLDPPAASTKYARGHIRSASGWEDIELGLPVHNV